MLNLQIILMCWLRFHQVRHSYHVNYIQGEGSGRMAREFWHGSSRDHGVCDLRLKGNMQVHEPILLQEFQKMNWKVQVQYLKAWWNGVDEELHMEKNFLIKSHVIKGIVFHEVAWILKVEKLCYTAHWPLVGDWSEDDEMWGTLLGAIPLFPCLPLLRLEGTCFE